MGRSLHRSVDIAYDSLSPLGGTDASELATLAEQIHAFIGLVSIELGQVEKHIYAYGFTTKDKRTFSQRIDMTDPKEPRLSWDVKDWFTETELMQHRVFRTLCLSFIVKYDLAKLAIKYEDA